MVTTNNSQDDLVGNSDGKIPEVDKEGRPKRWRRAGRVALRFALIVGVLFLVLVLGQLLLSSFSLQDLASFRLKLEHADHYLVFIRLGLITLLIVYWRPFNTWLAKVNAWPEQKLEHVLSGRWWALSILLFVELILVQRLHELFL
ncbi:MAG: hypothetical protein AB2761_19005 [Candidatus Thiodiazotropha endolucinida]